MKKIYIIAVVAALLSSVLIYGFLSSYDKKNGDGSVNYKTEKVVVALTDIPANTTVTDREQMWLALLQKTILWLMNSL